MPINFQFYVPHSHWSPRWENGEENRIRQRLQGSQKLSMFYSEDDPSSQKKRQSREHWAILEGLALTVSLSWESCARRIDRPGPKRKWETQENTSFLTQKSQNTALEIDLGTTAVVKRCFLPCRRGWKMLWCCRSSKITEKSGRWHACQRKHRLNSQSHLPSLRATDIAAYKWVVRWTSRAFPKLRIAKMNAFPQEPNGAYANAMRLFLLNLRKVINSALN